jgi:hypothetical protein
MPRTVQAFSIVALLALAACSGSTGFGGAGRIDYTRVDTAYSRADFAYAGSGRDMATDILGNPFPGVTQAAFDSAVTTAMHGAHFGPPTNFTTTPGESARPAYRVRLLWNGPLSANGNALCTDDPVQGGGGEPGGKARLVAAFCNSGDASTYVVGSVDGVSGPDDPRFVGFVRQVTLKLFPPRDGQFDPDRCFWPDC